MKHSLARAVVVLAVLSGLGCASDRYVGSIGRDHLYSNRGYGFTVRLAQEQIDERWTIVDPKNLDAIPLAQRPKVFDAALDLNGDGQLEIGETSRYLKPMLRLISKTSSAAQIDLDVSIIAAKQKAAPLEDLARGIVAELIKDTARAQALEFRATKAGPDFDTRIVTLDGLQDAAGPYAIRLAVIDQPDFLGEEQKTRRQLVLVTLRAPAMSDAMVADHLRVMDAILLNREAGPTTRTETW